MNAKSSLKPIGLVLLLLFGSIPLFAGSNVSNTKENPGEICWHNKVNIDVEGDASGNLSFNLWAVSNPPPSPIRSVSSIKNNTGYDAYSCRNGSESVSNAFKNAIEGGGSAVNAMRGSNYAIPNKVNFYFVTGINLTINGTNYECPIVLAQCGDDNSWIARAPGATTNDSNCYSMEVPIYSDVHCTQKAGTIEFGEQGESVNNGFSIWSYTLSK